MFDYSKCDQFLIELQQTLLSPRPAKRANPAKDLNAGELSQADKNEIARLMRINHTGEVCAQALYLGQAFVAKDKKTREHLLQAANDEADHLAWCNDRLAELNSHASVLNIAFFSLSVLTGMIAGLASDKISLGFIAETEKQVAAHLSSHLERIPFEDIKSRAIITQMHDDEIEHQHNALNQGGAPLPQIIQFLMQCSAKIMTKTTYYI
jgi:3-demethoxyubiquinol 3-hydroxylase